MGQVRRFAVASLAEAANGVNVEHPTGLWLTFRDGPGPAELPSAYRPAGWGEGEDLTNRATATPKQAAEIAKPQ